MHCFLLQSDRPLELIQQIKKAGMKVGVGVKPNTPVESVLPFVDLVDMVLIMTVEPGFGGQKFMADMMPKVNNYMYIYIIKGCFLLMSQATSRKYFLVDHHWCYCLKWGFSLILNSLRVSTCLMILGRVL